MSVEQIFIGSSTAGGSAFFTVRTAEKSPELVQAVIIRLLGDNLKQIVLQPEKGDNPFRIAANNKEAHLVFIDQDTEQPAFASPSDSARDPRASAIAVRAARSARL